MDDMVVSVGANGEFEAQLEASAAQSTSVQVGARYTDSNGWEDLNSFDSDFTFPTSQITAAAQARAFLRPQVNIEIYGLAGPYAYADAFVATDAEMYRDPFWKFTAGLDFGIGFVIDLPVVGKLAEWDKKLAGFEETLQESANAGPEFTLDLPTVVAVNERVSLSAYAEDHEDGPFCCSYSWESDVDGVLGTSTSIQRTFTTPGERTISLTVTDSHGEPTTKSATVYVAGLSIDKPSGSFRWSDVLPLQATGRLLTPSHSPPGM